MSSRGARLLLVPIQLKTGYLRISCGEGVAQDKETTQLVKQVRRLPKLSLFLILPLLLC